MCRATTSSQPPEVSTGEGVASPREPYRAGWRGHWAAICHLSARLAAASQRAAWSPDWSLGSSRSPHARPRRVGDPSRSNWMGEDGSVGKPTPPQKLFPSEGRGTSGRREEGGSHSKGFVSSRRSQCLGTRPTQASLTGSWAQHATGEAFPRTQGQGRRSECPHPVRALL